MGAAGHPLVRTPTLDALAADGVRFARHYSQAAPCSPGRAALYTGTYQMNNRVVANGTPLADKFDNLARVARRSGYDPTLFGYTDIGLDPLMADGPTDPRLDAYDGVLPGFSIGLQLPEDQSPWLEWLQGLGYDVPSNWIGALLGEPGRPSAHSHSAFLTDRFLMWLDAQREGWFAHVSYLRPHSPYAAAGEYSTLYDPADVPLPIERARDVHPMHETVLSLPEVAAPRDERAMREMRAQYYGMVTEVDAQLGRVIDAIKQRGEWDDTAVVVAADHGEQLGDHGLVEKLGYFEESYHVPLLVRDPRHPGVHGAVVDAFTENVDVLPTVCTMLGAEIPAQVDGLPLNAFLEGTSPPWWRDAAHWEWDWRYVLISRTNADGHSTAASSARTSRSCGRRRLPMCSSATAPGDASTSARTRRGGPSATSPRWSSRSPRPSRDGARSTSTGRTPRCCCHPSASDAGRCWPSARRTSARARASAVHLSRASTGARIPRCVEAPIRRRLARRHPSNGRDGAPEAAGAASAGNR